MRYLRRLTLNRRAPYDTTLYVDTTKSIVMGTSNNAMLPVGTTAQRPVSPLNGMVRYNTSLGSGGELEVFQSGTWRSLRFKESVGIVQQTAGIGDGVEQYFGPLNPNIGLYTTESGLTWDVVQMAKNILVIVENVIQISGTNYQIVQNPSPTVHHPAPYTAGYYIDFGSSPLGQPPMNKAVTVLYGFDR